MLQALRWHRFVWTVDGGERGSGDPLGYFHHPLQWFPVRGGAVTVPHCDTVGQYAVYGAAVEVHQVLRRQLGAGEPS